MEAPEMPAALTIGHSNRTWKDFLELLRARGTDKPRFENVIKDAS